MATNDDQHMTSPPATDAVGPDEQAAQLAAGAAVELRRIDTGRPRSVNQAHAVHAAIIIDEVLRLLRGADSGRTVILELLRNAAPAVVSSDVLRHASGIQEYARRIRELRDDGHDIRATGNGYRLLIPDTLSSGPSPERISNDDHPPGVPT